MLLHRDSKEYYPVSFLSLQPYDVKEQMQDWDEAFDWTDYFGRPGVEVYKMVVSGNDEIQGAIALARKEDHVFILLLEGAPHNRFGKTFKYVGLHLIAFACKRSMEIGHEGAVALESKTKPKLLSYYTQVVGAKHYGSGLMVIEEPIAEELVMLYLT
ncbi:hypothetical protein ACFPYJ_19375 [Paenibacillus solisilvae]|uniref:GNAT family N-acetyltransferase n=1 Tax=Paenibacillus solisilvae TaxID=2486751 RepID=A0ABW0W1A8_9BACL